MLIVILVAVLVVMAYALGHGDGVLERDEVHAWARFDELLAELRKKHVR